MLSSCRASQPLFSLNDANSCPCRIALRQAFADAKVGSCNTQRVTGAMSAAGGKPSAAGGGTTLPGKKAQPHSSRLAGMAFMQRAAQRRQLQQRKEQAVRCIHPPDCTGEEGLAHFPAAVG